MKIYSYEVFGKLDDELIAYCKDHHEIAALNDFRTKTITFMSNNLESLKKLHDEFFEDYEFEVKEVE